MSINENDSDKVECILEKSVMLVFAMNMSIICTLSLIALYKCCLRKTCNVSLSGQINNGCKKHISTQTDQEITYIVINPDNEIQISTE